MRYLFLVVLAAVIALPAYSSAQAPANPCSCTFWTPTNSDSGVKSLTITLEAKGEVKAADKYFLKLVDRNGDTVHYVKLTIPEGGKGEVVAKFDDLPKASSLNWAVLFSPEKNVEMVYLKVVGELEDGTSYSFFDYGCHGVVVGPKGCPRMELH